MATVIDRFVVELGLDPKKFTQGQRDAMDSFKKTQEEASRRGKEMERGTQSVGQAFSTLKAQALGLLAVFTGGAGLAHFTAGVSQADAQLGRLSRNIGVSAQTISAWQGAARLAGGDGADAANSFKAISDAFAGWKIGIVSPVIADFRAISAAGGVVIDVNDKVEDSFIKLADNLKRIHERDPATAGVLAGRIPGMTPAMFDLLIKGGAEVQKVLDKVKAIGTSTEESTKAAAELNAEFTKTVLILENVAKKAVVLGGRQLNKWTGPDAPPLGEGTSIADKIVQYLRYDKEQRRKADEEKATTGGAGMISVKPGAGTKSDSIGRLAADIQSSVPGIKQFTAFDDPYHALLGGGSAHSKGRALDFTIKDPSQSAAVAEQIRAKLKAMGVDGSVRDEYLNPSKNSTAPHIHVQFNSPDAAARYSRMVTGGAAAAAGAGGDGKGGSSTSTTTTITVGSVIVNTPATDGPGVARDFKAALERASRAANANAGQQ